MSVIATVLPKPTLDSSLDDIDTYWISKGKRITSYGNVSKSKSNPKVICSICYFECIENEKGIQIEFLRRSAIGHWQDAHKDLNTFVSCAAKPKRKGIAYFALKDGQISNGNITSKQEMIDLIEALPQNMSTDQNRDENRDTNDENALANFGFVPVQNGHGIESEDEDMIGYDSPNSNNRNTKKRRFPDTFTENDSENERKTKKRRLNGNECEEFDVLNELNIDNDVQYPMTPLFNSSNNDLLTFLSEYLPAMRTELRQEFEAMRKSFDGYEERMKREFNKATLAIANNKMMNVKRECEIKYYNDCLIVFGAMGFKFAENVNNILTKIGWCSVCTDAPMVSFNQDTASTFGRCGKETGEWFDRRHNATHEQMNDLYKFAKVLHYHYFDPKGSIKHRENRLKLQGKVSTRKALAFCAMARAFARVVSLGIGYTNYEPILEDYYQGGTVIGDHYHSRKFADTLLTYFYDDRMDQISCVLYEIMPATGCVSPFATTSDKSTDAAGTHEDQIIGYLDKGVKTYAEIGIKKISNEEGDEKTYATKKGLCLSLIDSLQRVKLRKDSNMRYAWASKSNDGEYIVKGDM